MKPIILVVGCPGTGKSWVCEQLRGSYLYVAHDDYNEREYVLYLLKSLNREKPVIGEIPFGLSKIQKELEGRGAIVIPVFLYESETKLQERWEKRGNVAPSTRQGHLKRQETYRERAQELGAFAGTSSEVLQHLRRTTF